MEHILSQRKASEEVDDVSVDDTAEEGRAGQKAAVPLLG